MIADDLEAGREALLPKVLDQVAIHGWTARALAAADPADSARLFPGGVDQALKHFTDWANRRMEASLEGTAVMEMRVRDRIALMVRLRLEVLEPHREAVRREAAYLAAHSPLLGPKLVWRIADRMWRLAGDTATDFNHYSKRALLSSVISATTLCWLGDTSEGHGDTWAFLDRRIDNVMSIGKVIGQAKKWGDPSELLDRVVAFAGRMRHRG